MRHAFFTSIGLLCLVLTCGSLKANPQEIRKAGQRGFVTFAPRIGIGVHNGFVFEGGLSALYIDNENLEFGAASLYATYFIQQRNFQSDFDVSGFKIGIQSSWAFFMWGFEVKTAFYNASVSTYISPKIGFSIMDVINLEYLINIAGRRDDYPLRSNHQVGFNVSLNKPIYQKVLRPFFQ